MNTEYKHNGLIRLIYVIQRDLFILVPIAIFIWLIHTGNPFFRSTSQSAHWLSYVALFTFGLYIRLHLPKGDTIKEAFIYFILIILIVFTAMGINETMWDIFYFYHSGIALTELMLEYTGPIYAVNVMCIIVSYWSGAYLYFSKIPFIQVITIGILINIVWLSIGFETSLISTGISPYAHNWYVEGWEVFGHWWTMIFLYALAFRAQLKTQPPLKYDNHKPKWN